MKYIACLDCASFYIGSTLRFLHLRIREHLTVSTSPVHQHTSVCSSMFSFNILATARDLQSTYAQQKPIIFERGDRPSIRRTTFPAFQLAFEYSLYILQYVILFSILQVLVGFQYTCTLQYIQQHLGVQLQYEANSLCKVLISRYMYVEYDVPVSAQANQFCTYLCTY